MLSKIRYRARDEKMYVLKSDDFLSNGRWGDLNEKTRRPTRGTSPTSPGCHRSLDRGSETGKKEYKTCSQESPPGHAMPEELELVPPPPGSPLRRAQPRSVPGLSSAGGGDAAGALTPEDEAAAPRGAGGGRCTPRGARLMLCSICPRQGTPQPPHGEKMRCRCLPP